MFRNYFKTAWRNLLKNKFYTAITITGLTAGLVAGILVLLWVQDELSFDKFHSKSANIYKLENKVGTGSSEQIWTVTAAPIGKLATQQLPEVKAAVRISYNYFYTLFTYKDKSFVEENKFFTDPSFFTVFDFPLINGNTATPFPDDNSMVITESTAKRYFGDDNPLGKIIVADDKSNFTVTGVIRDFPKNTAFKYDMLFPMNLLGKKLYAQRDDGRNLDNDFGQFNYTTYLMLQPGTELNTLAVKLRNIHLGIKPDDTDIGYKFLPLTKMHLYKSDGSKAGMETVQLFTIIALLILIIACINYVNLVTARSMLRSKEVSLRKIVGAGKRQLFAQFVLETVLLFLLATIVAIGIIPTLIPYFNTISGKELEFNLLDKNVWMVIGLSVTGTLILSSIYPALLLSSFEPLKALKGKMAVRVNDIFFRKALVVAQFAFSVILIAGTVIVSKQLNYIQSKQLGYDKEHVFSFFMREMGNHYDAVKASLLKQPGINGVTRSNGDGIVHIGNQTGDTEYEGKGPNETFMVYPMAIDKDFIPFFKMNMQQGNNFTGAVADSSHFILNETAVKQAGIKDPIGKPFRMWQNKGTIIGVVKDFHFASMKSKIQPAVFFYNPNNNGRVYVRTTGQDAAKAIKAVETEWKKYNGNFPFSYTFLDDTFNNLYKAEQRTGSLVTIFAAIAILISCLGLLGLTAYAAQIRTREIGVRKVLGASTTGIVRLLAKDFIRLVLIAIVLATPVSWYVIDGWLQEFVYKVDLSWTVFLIAGLVVMMIALITISLQSIKAALANPVKSLRSE